MTDVTEAPGRTDGIVVVGVGNVVLGDDGVGVRVVRALEDRVDHGDITLPSDVRVVDGGTLGLELLPMVADARALVLVDAADLGREPGSVEVIRGDAIASTGARASGAADLLGSAALMGTMLDAVSLVGIQPGEIEPGLELTAPVEAAMPAAIEATLAEIEAIAAARKAFTPRCRAGG